MNEPGKYLFLAGFLVMAVILTVSFGVVYTPPCEDGTAYYKCSTKNPGMFCLSTGLVQDDGTTADGCCVKVGGKIENGECVVRCQDGTKQGQCSTSSEFGQPYYCDVASGKGLVKDTAACSCPSNMESKNGDCVVKQGCIYDNPKCSAGMVCNKISNKCVSICDVGETYDEKTGKCTVPKKTTTTTTTTDNTDTSGSGQQDSTGGANNLNSLIGSGGNEPAATEQTDSTTGTSGSGVKCCTSLVLIGAVVLAGFAYSKKK